MTSEPNGRAGSSTVFDFADTLTIGLGMQKAGTTWLVDQLIRDPSVHCPKKEISYWNRIRYPYANRHKVRAAVLRRHGRWGFAANHPAVQQWLGVKAAFRADPYDHSGYVDLFRRGYTDQKVLLDFTPGYARLSSTSLDEITQLHANTRFLLLLRDPVDRFWSGVRHNHRWALSRGMAQDSLTRRALDILDDPDDNGVRYSRYDLLFEKPVLASEITHVTFFETMFTQTAYNEVAAFLGLDGDAVAVNKNASNASGHGQMSLPPEVAEKAMEVFAPAYAAMRARFGPRVPDGWRA